MNELLPHYEQTNAACHLSERKFTYLSHQVDRDSSEVLRQLLSCQKFVGVFVSSDVISQETDDDLASNWIWLNSIISLCVKSETETGSQSRHVSQKVDP